MDNLPGPSHKEISLESILDSLSSFDDLNESESEKYGIESAQEKINLDSPYLQAAAVLIFYDPKVIQPVALSTSLTETEKEEAIRELIGSSDLVIDTDRTVNIDAVRKEIKEQNKQITGVNPKVDDRVSFHLRDEHRRKLLAKLIKDKKVKQAINANPELTINSTNSLQSMLTRCLMNKALELSTLNLEQLNALCRVSDWLSETTDFISLPSKNEITRRIEMTEMLTPFKHLTGHFVDGEFAEQFRGRKDELATLRKYVGVAPPQGNLETFHRYVQQKVESVFDLKQKPPLLIYGIGGVGKSTLLAKFILDHAEAHKIDRFPFVYLDFDRPNLSALEPETLLIEAARQLAVQYADIDELARLFTDFYERWKNTNFVLTDSKSTETVFLNSDDSSMQLRENLAAMQSEFALLIAKLSERETKPFLVVLDTFEEVQYKGREYVAELYDFMTQLQGKYPLLRTVVAGRAPIYQFKTQELPLKSLDTEAAKGYLTKLGLNDPKEIDFIVSKVGGNPLSLKLAVELVKDAGLQELEETNLTTSRFFFLEQKLSEREIQGILYRRILGHIHNPKIRELAHPGLVLRFLTADLILKVLTKPCELKITTEAQAKELFDEMSREVSLVTQWEPNKLRHRPDVRKVMLKLIQENKPQIVEDIHQRAAAYYANQDGIANRAEEFYHRLSLNESPRLLDKRWIDGIQDYLMGGLDELPPKAQAYLSARIGVESVDLSIWDDADEEDRERRVIRQVADLLNSGLAERALKFIQENAVDMVANAALSVLHVKALSHLNRQQEAKETARQALDNLSNESAPDESIRSELNQYAESRDSRNDSENDSEMSFAL